MRADPLDLVVYQPLPVAWMAHPRAVGRLEPRVWTPGDHDRLQLDALEALAVRTDAKALALKAEIKSLVLFTTARLWGALDLRCLRGLSALQNLVVQSNTGIAHADALGELPALQHVTLYAYGRNRIAGLSNLVGARLESLELWFGGVGDLRALSALGSLRRLSVYENQGFSLAGIERLAIEELELWLPDAACDLRSLESLRALREVAIRGTLARATGEALARSTLRSLIIRGDSPQWDVPAIVALRDLTDRVSIEIETPTLAPAIAAIDRLPFASARVTSVDDAGVLALARAPRLRTLRVQALAATSLAPLAEHPALAELRFDWASRLGSLAHVPRVRFLPRSDARDTANRLELCRSPLSTISGIGSLAGVDHLDLRHCTALESLDGVDRLAGLRSIDLRHVTHDLDLSALAGATALQAIIVNHTASLPDGRFPASVRSLLRRDSLRGLVDRLSISSAGR